MGNMCNSDRKDETKSAFVSRKKRTLKDEITKSRYQAQITNNYNNVLCQFTKESFTLKKLHIKSLIGKGGQGSVFLVQLQENAHLKVGTFENNNNNVYAMKRIPKKKNQTSQAKRSLLLQNKIMSELSSPFISKMRLSCQDPTYLYYFMQIAKGGDLQSYTQSYIGKGNEFRSLGQTGIQFIAAGVLLGLECLHNHKIIYRDLKAENILISEDGYPMLSDFGLVLSQKGGRYFEPRGTIMYFAPEIVSGKGYNRGIDFWAYGIFLYYLAYQEYPFCVDDIIEPKFPEFAKKRQGTYKRKFRKISENLKDLINKLLVCKMQDRLGYESFDQIKNHEFFNSINWQKYEKKEYQSPLQKIVKKYPIEFTSFDQYSEGIQSDIADSFSFSNARKSLHSSCYQSETTRDDSDEIS